VRSRVGVCAAENPCSRTVAGIVVFPGSLDIAGANGGRATCHPRGSGRSPDRADDSASPFPLVARLAHPDGAGVLRAGPHANLGSRSPRNGEPSVQSWLDVHPATPPHYSNCGPDTPIKPHEAGDHTGIHRTD